LSSATPYKVHNVARHNQDETKPLQLMKAGLDQRPRGQQNFAIPEPIGCKPRIQKKEITRPEYDRILASHFEDLTPETRQSKAKFRGPL
jgi:hypothetical protein